MALFNSNGVHDPLIRIINEIDLTVDPRRLSDSLMIGLNEDVDFRYASHKLAVLALLSLLLASCTWQRSSLIQF